MTALGHVEMLFWQVRLSGAEEMSSRASQWSKGQVFQHPSFQNAYGGESHSNCRKQSDVGRKGELGTPPFPKVFHRAGKGA